MSQPIPTRQKTKLKPLGYRVTDSHGHGFTFERPGAQTKVVFDGQMMRWATSQWISQEFLDQCKALRDRETKAPRGDSTGCWQRVAEVPFDWLLGKMPKDAWGDARYLNKLLDDSDNRAWRTDGNHRRLG